MKKKLDKAINILGDIGCAGFSITVIHVGLKMLKWAFNEMDHDWNK